MLNIFKKRNSKHHKFIVKFIYSCKRDMVREGTWLFEKEWERECVVEADDIMDAGVEFAKKYVLSPNVCVTRIERVD